MTNPHQNPFGGNPFDPAPGAHPQPGPPPGWGPPPPATPGNEANTLATLSLVFAFVFAPAGAVLGHLGLSQIARTRQRGRERALIGVTLSYVIITAAVVSLVVWAALGHNDTGAPTAAPSPSSTVAAPSSTAVTTTTTTPPPPPPTVAPADLDALLPTAEEINAIPNMPPNMSLVGSEIGVMDRVKDSKIIINPAPCYTVYGVADSHGYDAAALQGIHTNGYHPPPRNAETIESVGGYADAAAAQAALHTLLDDWRSCGTTFTYSDPAGGGRVATWSVSPPADAGNGITTTRAVPTQQMSGQLFRAVAAKANVVVDVLVSVKSGVDSAAVAVAIANLIIGKIPGPR
jgi:eukaryotic-like serine/threonine-protein kinase